MKTIAIALLAVLLLVSEVMAQPVPPADRPPGPILPQRTAVHPESPAQAAARIAFNREQLKRALEHIRPAPEHIARPLPHRRQRGPLTGVIPGAQVWRLLDEDGSEGHVIELRAPKPGVVPSGDGGTPAERALGFLSLHHRLFGLRPGATSLDLHAAWSTAALVRFGQVYGPYPVLNASVQVSFWPDSSIRRVASSTKRLPSAPAPEPMLDDIQAIAIALKATNAELVAEPHASAKPYVRVVGDEARITWRVRFGTVYVPWTVYVDDPTAETWQVVSDLEY